ncbi:hypothetical protein EBS02_06505 [bacterium]|nr:hypothetical protein [bacterium]
MLLGCIKLLSIRKTGKTYIENQYKPPRRKKIKQSLKEYSPKALNWRDPEPKEIRLPTCIKIGAFFSSKTFATAMKIC